MSLAVCFKCGAYKSGAFVTCSTCGAAPMASREHAISLALSSHLSANESLAKYVQEIRCHQSPSVPSDVIAQASTALKDPQLLAMLGLQSSDAEALIPRQMSAQQSRSISSGAPMSDATATRAQMAQLATSALHKTPFAILGVTTRDDRRRIIERAEERSLDLDHDVCQKARSDLTNPRTRLSAEVAWLPGVSPRKASQLLDGLLANPMAMRKESSLPTLAHLNLLASAFESVDAEHDADDLGEFIQEMAYLVEGLSPDDVLRDINEDRTVSGFPQLSTSEQIEFELTERKRHYRDVIKDALDRLRPTTLVQVMTDTVDGATTSGQEHAPWLIDDLVDSYEIETQDVLQKEAANVHKLIKAARDAAPSGEVAVKPHVDKLCVVARNWDTIAQPIQLSGKARGIDHEPSRALAWAIRDLAIDLFNNHDLLSPTRQLTNLLRELFSEVPEVLERVGEDASALANISQRRDEAEAIEPIRTLCENVLKVVERRPSGAFEEGQRLLDEGKKILASLPVKATSPAYSDAKDILAAGLVRCAVAFGNETSKWAPCIVLLERALELSSDAKLRQSVNQNLATVKENLASLGDLEPIRQAPSLRTVNGIGVTLYGSTDHRPDGSYMATYYFVVLAIPIFPIARYRVIPTGGGYRFLGKGKLRTFDKWHIAVSLGLIALMFI
jgi:hypothetical protein